jgi:hypothetical protein
MCSGWSRSACSPCAGRVDLESGITVGGRRAAGVAGTMFWLGIGVVIVGVALYVGALSLRWTGGRSPRTLEDELPVMLSLVIPVLGGVLAGLAVALGT